VLPGFNDRIGEEQNIDLLTEELTALFQSTQKKIKNIQKHGNDSKDAISLNKNIQASLAAKLHELSSIFRKTQSRYLNSDYLH
jgi:syntaxin 16